jgi:hypothetical protein
VLRAVTRTIPPLKFSHRTNPLLKPAHRTNTTKTYALHHSTTGLKAKALETSFNAAALGAAPAANPKPCAPSPEP